MTNYTGIYIILFVICLVAAAFFCSAETAFIGMQKLRLRHLVKINHKKAAVVAKILEQPEKFLATVLLGINFTETAIAALGTVMAISWWGEQIGAAIATLLITIITLVFCEFIPKILAARYGEKIALSFARPLQIISTLLYPFVYILNRIGIRFMKLAGGDTEHKPTISQEEIRTAITVGTDEGVWEEDEAEMLHKCFGFSDRPVYETMVPRTEIIWIEKGIIVADFLAIYRKSPHSRFPIYEGTPDNVIGVLYIKDVLMTLADGSVRSNALIDDMIRPVYFVPENKPMGALLSEMKQYNYKMAVVVDEFGGVAGIATLDQLLEEIVGTIGDELVTAEKDIVTINANTFELDGGLRIEQANEELGLGLPTGDYETVAGFVLNHLGRVPKQGEHLKYHDLKLTIQIMKGIKIEKILVTREENATLKN
jgi:putative hemolysin